MTEDVSVEDADFLSGTWVGTIVWQDGSTWNITVRLAVRSGKRADSITAFVEHSFLGKTVWSGIASRSKDTKLRRWAIMQDEKTKLSVREAAEGQWVGAFAMATAPLSALCGMHLGVVTLRRAAPPSPAPAASANPPSVAVAAAPAAVFAEPAPAAAAAAPTVADAEPVPAAKCPAVAPACVAVDALHNEK